CQEVMLETDPESGTREVPVPEGLRPLSCLEPDQVARLRGYARKAEGHFDLPQDMEWVMDAEGRLYLLQSRPLRISPKSAPAEERRPTLLKDRNVLLEKGTIACQGVGAGPVHIVRSEEDLSRFPEGGVLVVRHTYPEFAAVLQKASAIVSDIGNVLGHLATVAREYEVPALFNTNKATRVLKEGMVVTVDARYANVYEGRVVEILGERGGRISFPSSPALKDLRDVLAKIVPLNLTDPRGPEFRPEGCRTLHDITRFAHEVSLRAIFDLSRESHFAESSTKQLVSGVPLKWWVIDLEDGVAPEVKGKKVKPEQIRSVPMQALWEGMTAVPWKGPPPMDTKGFLSVMLTASTDPSIDPSVGRQFADKNYVVLSRNFCNVSTRLGFHFSTTEAFLGEQENQNYISFVYTGGGADEGRRNRRAALISRLLEEFDFRVETKGDALFARVEGHTQTFLKERLKVLGYVIVQTRQMDMVMYNDKMVDWYYKNMINEIASFVEITK
ncbi:MAG: pyruvate, water dikinase, partial [Deltaproteobacteria bacterium]|nr:pyruvate, water dikinase [Deltaproteobacteria bacterium]